MALNFNDMLSSEGFDPETVVAFRHRPREPGLRKVLSWLAAERQDLFNAYQQTQRDGRLERRLDGLTGKGYVASFIGQAAGQATFVALYSVVSASPLPREQFFALPVYRELREFDENAKLWYTEEMAASRSTVQWFDLRALDFFSHWKGRLVMNWPGREISWWRLAHKNDLSIHAVHESSVFDSDMPRGRGPTSAEKS